MGFLFGVCVCMSHLFAIELGCLGTPDEGAFGEKKEVQNTVLAFLAMTGWAPQLKITSSLQILS